MLIVSLEMLLVFNHKPVDGDKRSVRLLFARPRLNKLLFVPECKPRGDSQEVMTLLLLTCAAICSSAGR
ncbi:hypothetical protein [Pantoea stewartii]|uniref:hypothetical protein n=1 Tax=Pantoea stewartii TaxID=66269 RepID=UPI001625E201|nr:hypothetical protein [Pantoea stewartii]MBC0852766.1 hypothetical protein [Pantoea stewartii]